MQQIRTHFRWFHSSRYLRLSLSLAFVFVLFLFVNAFIFLAQKPTDAQAQDTPVVAKVSSEPVAEQKSETPAEPVVSTPEPKAVAPAPKPTPTPPPAPKPTPAYDKVSIAGIGLSSRYVTVGLTSTNAIDVHPSLVGWWNGSAQPGTPGAVFLDGHNPGALSKLTKASEGMQVSLTKANGEVFNYTIVHIETVQLEGINMMRTLTPWNGATEGLNLMTCVGAYNSRTGTTDQRLVVYAVRS